MATAKLFTLHPNVETALCKSKVKVKLMISDKCVRAL